MFSVIAIIIIEIPALAINIGSDFSCSAVKVGLIY
jgi:hypothetical protein